MKTPLTLLLPALGWLAVDGARAAKVEYNRDVRPILSDKCFKCHGFDSSARKAKLRLDVREEALKPAESGERPIVPGKPEASEVIRRITSADEDDVMPPHKAQHPLKPGEIAALKQWIAEGAEYQAHWAFVPPKRGAATSIDAIVHAALEKQGLKASPEADAATLVRRASLALIGLPPKPEIVARYSQQPLLSLESYEALVDELLRSPHFGERLALEWLDAARFADTNGYYTDAERQAWPWRDWVIKAFNDNMPFDRFTIEQLAGDLLPGATTEQKIATAFNRNHMVSNESGIIEEEYRTSYVCDRVETTAETWLGLTMGCAKCHDHKYDPLTQRDYYSLFAAFNNIDERGIIKDVAPLGAAPAILRPTQEQEQQLAKLGAELKEIEARLKSLQPMLSKDLEVWERSALDSLPAVPAKGSLVHFDFDQDVVDHGPRHVEANTTGKLARGAGVKGLAAIFEAKEYIEFADPQPMERDQPFTLAVWIQPGGATLSCVASKQDSDGDARGFEVLWYKSQLRVNLAHRYGKEAIEVATRNKFSAGQWHHLAIAYDGSSKAAGLKIYMNGVLQDVDVRHDNLSGSIASREPWRIGWKGTGLGFEGSMDEFRIFDRALSAEEVGALHWRDFLESTLATEAAKRTKPQQEKLASYYIARHGSPELKELSGQVIAVRASEEAIRKKIVSVSVMEEMAKPRAAHILTRGQYDQPGDKVEFAVPASLGKLSPEAPQNRLGLAQWLVAKENPLTARVAVNRLWAQCFGDGLVRTPNDFGLQGEAPTNPELLDWLAVRFRDGDGAVKPWDVKALLKLIVMSATFRQSSHFTKELLTLDPDNRRLARGPRFRLPAELLRDQALAVGGLLVAKIGGPSVKPYQPPGLWEAVSYNGDASYHPDEGAALYRRGLYTFWKRQSPPPDMLTLDGPTREVCAIRRPRTNTPLQALLLLNDINYVEAARGLATRIMRSPSERLAHGFRLATGRAPKPAEAAELQRYFGEQLTEFRRKPNAAAKFLKTGASPVDASLDPCELAAWSMTANLLLNLDEVQTQH